MSLLRKPYPQLANRGEYTQFVGYFAVTPWNDFVDLSEDYGWYYNGLFFLSYGFLLSYINSLD